VRIVRAAAGAEAACLQEDVGVIGGVITIRNRQLDVVRLVGRNGCLARQGRGQTIHLSVDRTAAI
jgi:hypothetical protein